MRTFEFEVLPPKKNALNWFCFFCIEIFRLPLHLQPWADARKCVFCIVHNVCNSLLEAVRVKIVKVESNVEGEEEIGRAHV